MVLQYGSSVINRLTIGGTDKKIIQKNVKSPRPVFLNRRDASRYRDLEAFLPGLELFLKLCNSLNSALIGYHLVNENDWKCNSRTFYTSLVFCCWKKILKHILLGQANRDRDSNVKICRQPGLEAQKVQKHCPRRPLGFPLYDNSIDS